MLTPSQLPIGSIVNFDLYPTQVLGTSIKRAKVLAHLDADTAAFWIDPIALHANVYPTLPEGVPNSYKGYLYVKLQLASGEITAIGFPWIREETVAIVSTQTIQLTIANVSAEDQNAILEALSANGFSAVDVAIID